MTVDTRVCSFCQQEIGAEDSSCPHCGKTLESDSSWPEWHGKPSGETGEAWLNEAESITGEEGDAFEELTLDPDLTNVPIVRKGKRSQVVWCLLSAVIWLVAEIMFRRGDPASFWDYIWYGAAVVTIGIGVWLLVLLWRRARTHGLGAAVRWLVS